ncbi:MAG: bifunctional adenosylcobinamide kinase/adenosylcobinamide-phosphate guanylyltransferase [Aliishimia sp.]
MLPALTLVLGGAASGKSAFAEDLITSSDLEPVYIATARALDPETKVKINIHQARRGSHWKAIEAHGDLSVILSSVSESQIILLECTTMWLTNRLMADLPLLDAPETFLNEIAGTKAPLVVVSNELGQGIVPENAMARAFREAQGRLNIQIAQNAGLVIQVVAGLPNVLKGSMP